MPKLANNRFPAYRLHKARRLAVVTLNGKDFYLGPYGSEASKLAYDRLIAEWVGNGRRFPTVFDPREVDLTIAELSVAYWNHAQGYYVKAGRPTSELSCIRSAIRPLNDLYGRTPASQFGPLALKAVRARMMADGSCRKYVNDQVSRIKQMFKWGVANEPIPGATYQALQTVSGLRKGRYAARESDIVGPVLEEYVDAVESYVSGQVWAMVTLQRLTGMRPGEAVAMQVRNMDMTGQLWEYRPLRYKTEHLGRERVIPLGPRAQAAIRPFLLTL